MMHPTVALQFLLLTELGVGQQATRTRLQSFLSPLPSFRCVFNLQNDDTTVNSILTGAVKNTI
jgi:hypothetical protein